MPALDGPGTSSLPERLARPVSPVLLAMREQCPLANRDGSGSGEGARRGMVAQGEVGEGMVPGAVTGCDGGGGIVWRRLGGVVGSRHRVSLIHLLCNVLNKAGVRLADASQ